MRPPVLAAVPGMGYIALEMCESLVGLNIAVDMVKPNPLFLPWLEPSMAQIVKDGLEAKGVGVYAGHAVERIEKTADGLQAVKWFRNGDMEKLVKYCRQDVVVTRDLFDYGIQHGHLIYREKKSGRRLRLLVDWKLDDLIQ